MILGQSVAYPSGIGPVSLLLETSISIRFGSLLNIVLGNVSVSLLLESQSFSNFVNRDRLFFGMGPVKRLSARLRYLRLLKVPILAGIVPLSLFPGNE